MIFEHWLVILSAIISISGSSVYIFDTLKGKTKPNRVSWFMWAIAPLIATGAALYASADIWVTVRTFLAGFMPLIILTCSFVNKQSYWKLTKLDMACGACSLLALIVWFFANSPTMAILLLAVGDGLAALPTIFKVWKHPETETGLTFLMALLATVIIFPSIPVWNIQNSAFQIYLFVVNIFIVFSIYRKQLFFKK
ncbi:MAG: hypothetical protein NT155_02765 [Candidatus Staskawiczbacteria bacterium]|nr:hypothetical protein [Candidatus Staskawiczbacteria bacterium]